MNPFPIGIENNLPDTPLGFPDEDPDTLSTFTLRAKGFSVPGMNLQPTDTEAGVAKWIEELPAATVAHILHATGLAGPEWNFGPVTGVGTQKLKSDLIWFRRLACGLPEYRLTLEVKSPCQCA